MSEKKSKFAGLLRSRAGEEPSPEAAESPQEPQNLEEEIRPPSPPQKRPRGRPGGQGKRLNPDYAQVTAYIPAKLHTDTKINLLKLPKKKEFSELIEELLTKWNEKQSA